MDSIYEQGNMQSVCQADGTWSGSPLECTVTRCPSLSAPANGSVVVSHSNFTIGTVVTHSCVRGYTLVGATATVCEEGGFWSDAPATCTIVRCPISATPRHAQRVPAFNDTSTVTYGTLIHYSCNAGHTLVGAAMLECLEDGYLDFRSPYCVVSACPVPDSVANSVRHGDIYKFNHTVAYQCNTGFYLLGTAKLTCTRHGNWSAQLPFCRTYECDTSFPPPAEGTTITSQGPFSTNITLHEGDTIITQCNAGYDSTLPLSALCRGGNWTPVFAPNCTRLICPAPISSGNNSVRVFAGTPQEDVHVFHCQRGYSWLWPFPTYTLTCGHDLQWSGTVPNCTLVACPPLPVSPSVTWSSPSGVFQDAVTGQCKLGFELVRGNLTQVCQAGGQWSGDMPVCEAVQCPAFQLPPNVVLSYFEGNSYSNSLWFTCTVGYKLTPPTVITCTANSTWSNPIPNCHRINCPPVPQLTYPSGIISSSQSSSSSSSSVSSRMDFSTVVHYMCMPGYSLDGAWNTTCSEHSNWTNPAPTCRPISCNVSDLGGVQNGYHSVLSFAPAFFGQAVTWRCQAGFRLIGSATQTCTQDTNLPGRWSGMKPVCDSE
ncbi:CUB and sushi domain-containing protein 3-like [Sycon ciliatum]|uniref:CUB and sushi domain-containing protein 3-like n=1 Tax=Sycon ciliatum TaxID=27933 RepID=UPI0031F6A681